MKTYTEAEISALKGTELVYEFTAGNGPQANGKSAYAYVAQADINKGITIRGFVPVGTEKAFGLEPGEEAVLACCRFIGNDITKNEDILDSYVKAIRSGIFSALNTTGTGGGGSAYMASRCVF